MSAEHLPCPFCGSKNVKAFTYDAIFGGEPDAYCQCQDCSVTGPNGKTEAEAIAAWNRRAVETQAADFSAVSLDNVGELPPLPWECDELRFDIEAWLEPRDVHDIRAAFHQYARTALKGKKP